MIFVAVRLRVSLVVMAETDVILTPDQRVRVFISSTLGDLAGERAAARRAIGRLHLVPVWYESGARPHPPRSMYRAYLAQSQVFVGIYWQRYGWVAPGMEISGLEDEFRLAAGKPMLLYLKRPAPDQEPRLTAFLDSIRAAGTVSYRTFATARELERLLADDLAVLLSESFAGEPGGAELPAGTVTFLLTDIEGSTRLWETVPEAMEVALERHNRLVTGVIEGHGGVVVTSRGEGDSFFAVFASAVAAVEAAGACQLRLGSEPWPEGAVLRVRMGLHTGEAHVQEGDYVDHAPINRCARVKAAAYGGQVLVTKTTRELVGGRLGGGFGLKQLGEFRLRDLPEPELIYQLTHADLPADFPALKTIHVGNLPVPVSSFIGRARELERTAAALGQARVVTLTGVGGVGKTRLALQAAGQVAERLSDGAWLCELAPIRDPAGVDDAVAAVFSVTAQAGQSTRGALVELLRSKQLLLLLDNCEHLLEGAAALAAVLARSCERLVILATSREALGIEGERLVVVPSLGVPGADADLEMTASAEAVRLFAERAAAVKPGFAVTAGNAAAVAAVVRRLDGVPLAIELAAARAPAMTPAELARRLERSFAVLAAGPRGAVGHHQTLRATIDWSFELLTGPEQALLARLAVFAGGCTLEAAEAVCGGEGIDPDMVFELLASLVARSLIVAGEHGPQTRYRLLETIRQYGEERLNQAGETEPPTPTPPPRPPPWAPPPTPATSRVSSHGSGNMPTTLNRTCSGRCGSAPSRTTCSRRGRGRSAPATWAPRSRSWPASPLPRSGPVIRCCSRAARPWSCRARPRTRATRSPSRSAPCSRRCAPIGWAPRSYLARRPTPTPAGTARTGGSRKLSAPPAQTPRLLPARSPTPAVSPNAPLVSRGPAATSPTPLSSSPSPRGVTCWSATRPERYRWRARRSPWPARSAPRPWSRPVCSPWARPSPAPTPARPAPAWAKAASSAPRSAIRAPSTTSGPPGSRFSRATRPPRSNSAAVPSAPSSGAVTASGWASSFT
jgi:predicted ATPase/class 3 adenylate cyclase